MRYEVVVKETHMKLVKITANDGEDAKELAEHRSYDAVLRTVGPTIQVLSVIRIRHKGEGGKVNEYRKKTATNRK